MAKAIRQINKSIPTEEELQLQAISDIIKALGENRDAILTSLDILKNLHDMGALQAVQVLLEQRVDVATIALKQINQPAMHHTIKNAFNAIKFLGSVKPEQLQLILQGLSHGLERSSENRQQNEQQSLWKMGKSLRDPDIKTSLLTAMDFLQGMGEVLNNNNDGKTLH
jgi:uncharacterized protein YjgD (DUF1641 family)